MSEIEEITVTSNEIDMKGQVREVADAILKASRIQSTLNELLSQLEIDNQETATIGDIQGWLATEHRRLAIQAFQVAEAATGCTDHSLRDFTIE